jgi:peptide/nickel transport system substrate-binding protein
MCLRQRARSAGRCWERSRMRNGVRGPNHALHRLLQRILLLVGVAAGGALLSCSANPDPNTLVMIIDSSPTNLDPRVGIDAQSERIDSLIFDYLFTRGGDLNVAPGLAEHWDIPDSLTYVFHLRRGVKFHDGRPLSARDVKWTFDSLLTGKIRSPRAAAYRFVDRVDAPDDFTAVFHMKEPDSALLWNLSEGAVGIVPYGSGDEMTRHPVGSGPFKFVSAETDRDVVVERNDDYWGEKPTLARVRFAVVPDATTQALEMRKGSADVVINGAFAPDTVITLQREQNLLIERGEGTRLAYLSFNLRDPILKDARVRQAIAYALDRRPMIEYLWRGQARPARSVLPPQSWAYNGNVPPYDHDPAKAEQLLDAAGYPAVNGVRFHITMKTSTDENTRLMVAVMQQQLREVGIMLDIRSFEFATFFSDVTHGLFQMYGLRWIGGNEDPDIFYAFHSSRFPPNGTNRAFYSNPKLDALVDQARREVDPNVRKPMYAEVQQILADDLPYINLWYLDNVLVHTRRVRNLKLNPAGNYDFLRTAELAQ